MYKNLTITSLLGALGIILGAFGAHALKSKLSITAMESFQTAVEYQLLHVVVLLFVNGFTGFSDRLKKTISICFFLGILFFSGSIYAIHLAGVSGKSIWFITPLGGVLFIVGWGLLFYHFLKKSYQK